MDVTFLKNALFFCAIFSHIFPEMEKYAKDLWSTSKNVIISLTPHYGSIATYVGLRDDVPASLYVEDVAQ